MPRSCELWGCTSTCLPHPGGGRENNTDTALNTCTQLRDQGILGFIRYSGSAAEILGWLGGASFRTQGIHSSQTSGQDQIGLRDSLQ
ncbi:hypothetical protein ATANTOWER_023087 [Ataeniobius toweri]|uniref:Uncharacterized protein n=1 Tax=Ataeniobius toweri TaxID=208326 RepID=A0ABU7AZ86_9TELE|nr:hypothetical protein [Ataeniobius toweri]